MVWGNMFHALNKPSRAGRRLRHAHTPSAPARASIPARLASTRTIQTPAGSSRNSKRGSLSKSAIVIGAGTVLIAKFAWIIYVFGAFLILTGIKMIVKREEEIYPERNPVVKWFKKLMPVTSDYRENKFFVHENGIRMATPLFVVLFLVEISDVIFAVDSIPAIFAVTTDPFIVYTSNVFAILGLRSLYFALAGVMDKFHYLKIGLGVVLTFVGVKMLLAHTAWKIDTLVSLGVIVLTLAASVVMSLLRPKKTALPSASPKAGS